MPSSACRRAQRGAERDELLAELEGLEAWYRDLVVVAAGAEGAVVHADRLEDLREDVAAGCRGRRRRGGRDGARDVARARGVQPQSVARAGGAVRPSAACVAPARRVLPTPDRWLHSSVFADVAQLVEHFTRNEGVPGSSPGVGFSAQAESGHLARRSEAVLSAVLSGAGRGRSRQTAQAGIRAALVAS